MAANDAGDSPPRRVMRLTDIDPDGVYSLADLCRLVPSRRAGKRVHLTTALRWARQGVVPATKTVVAGREKWHVLGADLIRFARGEPNAAAAAAPEPRSATAARVAAAAQAEADARGRPLTVEGVTYHPRAKRA